MCFFLSQCFWPRQCTWVSSYERSRDTRISKKIFSQWGGRTAFNAFKKVFFYSQGQTLTLQTVFALLLLWDLKSWYLMVYRNHYLLMSLIFIFTTSSPCIIYCQFFKNLKNANLIGVPLLPYISIQLGTISNHCCYEFQNKYFLFSIFHFL